MPQTCCKQGASVLSNQPKIVSLWLSTTRCYFRNNGFDVTDMKLVNEDICQPFKANQWEGNDNYILNFY